MFSSWLNSLGERGQTHKKDVIKLNLQDKTTEKAYEVINLPFLFKLNDLK